jgi:hypothetical protein
LNFQDHHSVVYFFLFKMATSNLLLVYFQFVSYLFLDYFIFCANLCIKLPL